jgi:hypothetical protein
MWLCATAIPEKRLAEMPEATVRSRLMDAGAIYARREKATRSGYHPDDEMFYGMRILRELLPYVVSDTTPTMRSVDERVRGIGKSAANDKAFEFETALADVRKVYARLERRQQNTLRDYAAGHDIPERDVSAALRALQRKLGGRRPNKLDLTQVTEEAA